MPTFPEHYIEASSNQNHEDEKSLSDPFSGDDGYADPNYSYSLSSEETEEEAATRTGHED